MILPASVSNEFGERFGPPDKLSFATPTNFALESVVDEVGGGVAGAADVAVLVAVEGPPEHLDRAGGRKGDA